jgi:AraC-like DNA-binding protein
MESVIVTIVFACCATAHFVGMCVMAMLARHHVQYLSLAWIMAIFSVILSVVAVYGEAVAVGRPGILNPYMMLMLVVGAYLQSIYSLGIVMPGFLQWSRMWKYATPIFLLTACYILAMFPAERLTNVYSMAELFQNIFSLDLILRCIALLMGGYYILNIVFLPYRMARKTVFPMSLVAYLVVLVLSVIFYLYTALNYTPMLLCIFLVLFTIVNFFWISYSIETLLVKIPHPDISMCSEGGGQVLPELVDNVVNEQRQVDFNEMNLQRYLRVQNWMQTNKKIWTDNGFTRDKLCEETGINRQLMLQCLRSQGHNNIHEYIATYRIREFMRMIVAGEATTVADCYMVGFAAPKTARSCFERIEGENLDSFIASRSKSKSVDTDKVL